MKKYIHVFFALVMILLLFTISPVQASEPDQGVAASQSPSSIPPLDQWKTDYIHTADSAGTDISIAFDPDHGQAPWISYHNKTDGGLWVAHYIGGNLGNCGPLNTWFCEPVDQVTGDVKGLYTSIDVFPDINPDPNNTTWKVGVSYYDATHRAIKYAFYKCPINNPCSWSTSMLETADDIEEDVGLYTSLEFGSTGAAHIAYYAKYYQTQFNSLYSVRHAFEVEGSSGNCGSANTWRCETANSSLSRIGSYPSIDLSWKDEIFIAYYAEGIGQLQLAYYQGASLGNCGTDNAWNCITIDDTGGGEVGLYPSFHAPQDINDRMQVAYYDKSNGSLKYAYQYMGGMGNCGLGDSWQCDSIDFMGADLQWASISLAVDSGYSPMIAYTYLPNDLGSFSLHIAEPVGYGDPSGTCEGAYINWNCYSLDSGDAYVDDGQYAALEIKQNGMAVVAYSETLKDYPGTVSLKVTYQVLKAFLPLTRR